MQIQAWFPSVVLFRWVNPNFYRYRQTEFIFQAEADFNPCPAALPGFRRSWPLPGSGNKITGKQQRFCRGRKAAEPAGLPWRKRPVSAPQPNLSRLFPRWLGTIRESGGPIRAEETLQGNDCICEQKSVCTLKTSNKNRIYTVFL